MKITYKELEDIIRDEVSFVINKYYDQESEEKQCIKGNPVHLDSGRFGNAKDGKGSWSISKGNTSGRDCEHGQYKRTSASHKKSKTSTPCGRSGKYLCKSGEVRKEGIDEMMVDPQGNPLGSNLHDIPMDDLAEEVIRRMNEGGYDLNAVFKICNAINQTSDGKLGMKK